MYKLQLSSSPKEDIESERGMIEMDFLGDFSSCCHMTPSALDLTM